MRLVSYAVSAGDTAGDADWRAGVLVGDRVVDAAAAGRQLADGAPLHSVRQVLRLGNRLGELGRAAAAADEAVGMLGEVRLAPPVPDPDKILCIGLNYRAHAAEAHMEAPVAPTAFAKFRNSLVGDGAAIVVPPAAHDIDYEGEMAVVIGRRCRRVDAADAMAAVAGVMPFNDVSARDLQMQTPQWTAGKAVDTFAPCGPALVLLDEIDDVQDLRISTRLNDDVVQDAQTSQMIFSVAEIIAFLSAVMTLEPGDIIATGTPEGVGFSRTPPLLMQPGDRVTVEIEGVGTLRNVVAREA
jgi:2-keto-4-pentenoate hydratase/2-oxohepta-3-ene-1,7-dioic acid hydratase in catechol pathway